MTVSQATLSASAHPQESSLVVYVPGATTDEHAKGRAAALAVFDAADCTAYEAAKAFWLLEGQHEGDGAPMTEKQDRISTVWLDAQAAAAKAICAGWS